MSVIAATENLSQLSLASVNDNIISLLECPVCYDYLVPPIHQCKNAHNICSQCKQKITKCPICKGVFLNSRSVLVEQIVEKLLYPCMNSGGGCHEKRSLHDILKHHGECPHRMYECLPGKGDSCNWTGRSVDILDHTVEIHASKCWMHDVNNVLYDFNIFEGFEDVQLVSAHDEIFWYNFSCDNVKQKIFLAVQYIGSKEQACMFVYEFQLYTDDDEERSIIIKNRTHPDTEKVSDIYDTGCCIMLDFAMLRQYVDNGNRMTFWLRVSRSNTSQFLEWLPAFQRNILPPSSRIFKSEDGGGTFLGNVFLTTLHITWYHYTEDHIQYSKIALIYLFIKKSCCILLISSIVSR